MSIKITFKTTGFPYDMEEFDLEINLNITFEDIFQFLKDTYHIHQKIIFSHDQLGTQIINLDTKIDEFKMADNRIVYVFTGSNIDLEPYQNAQFQNTLYQNAGAVAQQNIFQDDSEETQNINEDFTTLY